MKQVMTKEQLIAELRDMLELISRENDRLRKSVDYLEKQIGLQEGSEEGSN